MIPLGSKGINLPSRDVIKEIALFHLLKEACYEG